MIPFNVKVTMPIQADDQQAAEAMAEILVNTWNEQVHPDVPASVLEVVEQ